MFWNRCTKRLCDEYESRNSKGPLGSMEKLEAYIYKIFTCPAVRELFQISKSRVSGHMDRTRYEGEVASKQTHWFSVLDPLNAYLLWDDPCVWDTNTTNFNVPTHTSMKQSFCFVYTVASKWKVCAPSWFMGRFHFMWVDRYLMYKRIILIHFIRFDWSHVVWI